MRHSRDPDPALDPGPAPPRFSFDAGFYRRYYGDPATRVADRETAAALADFVFSYLRYLRLPIGRVLDLGCGIGLWREQLERHHPGTKYVGVEHSAHACQLYGWEQGSVADYEARERFDLVICQDVLQYLDDAQAQAAMANLRRLAGRALFFQALTREDWDHACDQTVTDGDVYLRPADWYRRRLRRSLIALGGGLFLAPGAPAVLYALERPG